MTEVVLNDKCMHCNNRECHDGYNFCNQAMKDNSFYKNAKLYRGLEAIQRPSYEELKKEAEENSFRYALDKPWVCEVERKQIMAHFEKGYLTGAGPRERQIQIDAEYIRVLQKQNGELTDKVKELEAQNEKMKCCENCAFFKDKKYDICHRINKLGTRKCAFYKMI